MKLDSVKALVAIVRMTIIYLKGMKDFYQGEEAEKLLEALGDNVAAVEADIKAAADLLAEKDASYYLSGEDRRVIYKALGAVFDPGAAYDIYVLEDSLAKIGKIFGISPREKTTVEMLGIKVPEKIVKGAEGGE